MHSIPITALIKLLKVNANTCTLFISFHCHGTCESIRRGWLRGWAGLTTQESIENLWNFRFAALLNWFRRSCSLNPLDSKSINWNWNVACSRCHECYRQHFAESNRSPWSLRPFIASFWMRAFLKEPAPLSLRTQHLAPLTSAPPLSRSGSSRSVAATPPQPTLPAAVSLPMWTCALEAFLYTGKWHHLNSVNS